MPFRLLLGCLLLIAAPATAQLTIESLEATHSNGTLYRFPLIGGDSPQAARVNTFLQTRELEKLPGHFRESPFEDIWPEKDSFHGVTEMDYTLSFVQPGILTVSIVRLAMGAYPSELGDTYHFDARTGEPITLRSLLTAEGFAALDAEITRERLQRIDDFVAGKRVGGAELRSDPELAEEQKRLYRDCRGRVEKRHPVIVDELRLGRNNLTLVRESCGARVMAALDELDLSATRHYERSKEQLNDYARCLLIERRASCERKRDVIEVGVYRGTIGGRYPITLVVAGLNWDGLPYARYYYDKQGKPISLRASLGDDGSIGLAESGPPPARFELRRGPDGQLQGEWTQEDKPPQTVELR